LCNGAVCIFLAESDLAHSELTWADRRIFGDFITQ
jgi:hypothetical protein